jgi:trehalose utilization protein
MKATPKTSHVSQNTSPNVILVWSEGTAPKSVYPDDIRGAVAAALKGLPGKYTIQTATLTDPEQGVPQELLDRTAVLFWWGHQRHGDVKNETVARIVKAVKENGMGFVALHSSHYAKPFQAIVGASGSWKDYPNDGKPQNVKVLEPRHPIARGVRDFVVPREERYEEPFDVPKPEATPFDAYYEGSGNRARQGLCWTIGKGRVFYFRLGHEEYPIYFQTEVKRILRNAALWAAQNDEAIWEDNDPFGKAARATGEPPLSLILRTAGFGGTDVTKEGEIAAELLQKMSKEPVKYRVLAAYGTLKTVRVGWYEAGNPNKRRLLSTIDAPNNKQMNPPLLPLVKSAPKLLNRAFDPKNATFGLWVASESFPGEVIYTEDSLQKAIPRFSTNLHKVRAYAAVTSEGQPLPNAIILGFEYSTNDDYQEVVMLVENIRIARKE